MAGRSFFRRLLIPGLLALGAVIIGTLDAVARIEQIQSWGPLAPWGEPIAVGLLAGAVIVFLYQIDRRVLAVEDGTTTSLPHSVKKTRYDTVQEWLPISDSVGSFGDKGWIETRDQKLQRIDVLNRRRLLLEKKYNDAIKAEGSFGYILTSSRAGQVLESIRKLDNQLASNRRIYNVARSLLRDSIHGALKDGTLLARGMKVGHAQLPGPETNIAASEWRYLVPNPDNETAIGHGAIYIGVVIGCPSPDDRLLAKLSRLFQVQRMRPNGSHHGH